MSLTVCPREAGCTYWVSEGGRVHLLGVPRRVLEVSFSLFLRVLEVSFSLFLRVLRGSGRLKDWS